MISYKAYRARENPNFCGEGEVNACINIECKYGYEIKCGVNEDCYEMGKKADLGWVNSMPGSTYLQGSNANCEGKCAIQHYFGAVSFVIRNQFLSNNAHPKRYR